MSSNIEKEVKELLKELVESNYHKITDKSGKLIFDKLVNITVSEEDKKIISEFGHWLIRHEGKSASTAKAYVRNIKALALFLRLYSEVTGKDKNLRNFNIYDLSEFVLYGRFNLSLFREGYLKKNLPQTKNITNSALRAFVRFMSEISTEEEKDKYRELFQDLQMKKGKSVLAISTLNIKPVYKTVALDTWQVRKLIDIFSDKIEVQAGLVLAFWFGWRAVEGTKHLLLALNREDGYVDFKNRRLMIRNAKQRSARFTHRILPWCEELDEYMFIWCNFLKDYVKKGKGKRLEEFLTKKLKGRRNEINYSLQLPSDVVITEKTARYTVETKFKEAGISQRDIDTWLGHVSISEEYETGERRYRYIASTSASSYTDLEKICENVFRKELIENRKHFMFEVLKG